MMEVDETMPHDRFCPEKRYPPDVCKFCLLIADVRADERDKVIAHEGNQCVICTPSEYDFICDECEELGEKWIQ